MPKEKVKKNRSQLGKMAKNKGAKFERDIVKIFKDYGFECERTPRSGAMGKTVKSSFGKKFSGDIIFENDNFPFQIECKNQESLDFNNIMENRCTYFYNWLEQCVTNAESNYKKPMLIMTRNRLSYYVCIREKDIPILVKYPCLTIYYCGYDFLIINFKDFMKENF